MDESVEARVIDLHLRHHTQDEIDAALHTSKTRVSRSVRHLHEIALIPNALRVGRPSKVTGELASYIEARTIQTPSTSGESLSVEISEHFGVSLSRTAVNGIRSGRCFK
jgi:transposase